LNFNENQLKAINHYEGNCCVLSSAGSGKTSVLTNRIVNLINMYNVRPENILAITFSVKAKENMQERLLKLIGDKVNRITIETFHALGNKMLKECNYNYFHNKIKVWQQKQFINNIVVKTLKMESNEKNVDTNDILNFISYQKNNLLDCNDELIETKYMPYSINIMQYIYQRYEEIKKNEKVMDFDDMLLYTYKLLANNDLTRDKYQDRYKFISSDEFQDVNVAQYEFIRLLGKKHNNVFVVGDALQNIYEFRGANNNYLIDFHKDWIDTIIIPLNTNYRSSQDIVELSNKLVKNTKETTHKYYYESIAHKPNFKSPEFSYFTDEISESEGIANKILEIKNSNSKCKFSDFAILTRTNYQIQAIERGLYKNNIPYEIIGSTLFYEQKEIKDMISYLRLVKNINNDEAFKQIYNSPNRYLGVVFLNEVTTYSHKYNKSLFASMLLFPRSNEWRYKNGINEIHDIVLKIKRKKKYKVGDLINIIRKDLDYDKYISKEDTDSNIRSEKIDNLDILVFLANKYDNIDKFLEDVDNLLGFSKGSDSEDRVKVMTCHKSKGLEYPIVFVAGVNDGLLPHAKSGNEAEERRLLYVGMTRAENQLFLSSTRFYGNRDMGISKFIYDLFEDSYIRSRYIGDIEEFEDEEDWEDN